MKRARTLWLAGVLALVLLAAGTSAWTQEKTITKKDVPAAVLAAFAKAYPKAVIRGYSTEVDEGRRVYEVESVEGKTHRDITYASDGKVVSVEESLDASALPAPVRAAFEKKFPGARILLAEKVTAGATQNYELHFEHNGKKAEVVYDAKGIEQKH